MSALGWAAVIFVGWLAGALLILLAVARLKPHKPMPAPDRPGSDEQFGQWLGDGDVDLAAMADAREAAERKLRRYR